jgi:hypothetical protein
MARRKAKDKLRLLAELEENPLITRACAKIDIGRSTFYNWCNEDPIFKVKVEWAQKYGRYKLNDFVESKLLENIHANHQTAIVYWLSHNHPAYMTPVAQEFDELRTEVRSTRAAMSDLLDILGSDNTSALFEYLDKSKVDTKRAKALREKNEKALRRFA